MRYASIRSLDISNGEDIGVSLFVQGCDRHCFNCFNPESWDFNGGFEWDKQARETFFSLVNRPFIKRVTILGGEPLADQNLKDIYDVITTIKTQYPHKTIWLYTGYTLSDGDFYGLNGMNCNCDEDFYWYKIIESCDVIVDGEYKDNLRDITLQFRGSSNQRLIDVKKSMQTGHIVLWGDTNE